MHSYPFLLKVLEVLFKSTQVIFLEGKKFQDFLGLINVTKLLKFKTVHVQAKTSYCSKTTLLKNSVQCQPCNLADKVETEGETCLVSEGKINLMVCRKIK